MPFAGLEGSQDAEAENGGDGREPGAKQTNPASIRRRPQIFRKQCRCAKSDGIPFERQLETFPPPPQGIVFHTAPVDPRRYTDTRVRVPSPRKVRPMQRVPMDRVKYRHG